MRSKNKAWTKRDETLSNTQTELSEVAAKLKSLGDLAQSIDAEASPSLDGLGLILSELSAQLETITDRIDPANLK